jgi:CheY-like chemotaxis protein
MARVLVVDEDPWTQRMVSAVLSHVGHLVDLASDGWEALIRAGRAHPDVVVTELKLPTSDGWSLAETLRSRDGATRLPFIFLASLRSDRKPGRSFRPDQDQIVAKPFRLEALEMAVATALAGVHVRVTPARMSIPFRTDAFTSRGDTEPGRRAVLTGLLDEFGLSSLLIVLELERKSGVVILHGPPGVGRIFLRSGRVVRAQVDGSPPRRGPLAVYELLSWARGRFEFNSGEVAGDDEIGSSTSFLLLEGARLQDEQNHDKENN